MSAEKSDESDSSGIVSFLNRWINDILGLVFPGYLLLLLLIVVFGGFDLLKTTVEKSRPDWFGAALSIGLAYFFGNFLTAFGERFVFRPIGWLCTLIRDHSSSMPKWLRAIGDTLVPENVGSEEALARSIGARGEFQAFRKIAKEQHGVEVPDRPGMRDVRILRSIAISATPEVSQLTTKFTFLAILNGNIATVALLLAFALMGYSQPWTVGDVNSGSVRLYSIPICGIFFYVHALVRYEHYRRSMTTPFSGAIGRVKLQRPSTPVPSTVTVEPHLQPESIST